MAKTLKQLGNGLRIKHLVKQNKYFIFWGSMQCIINGEYQQGFSTIEKAESVGNILQPVHGSPYRMHINPELLNSK